MDMLAPYLIGGVLGAALALAAILGGFKVQTKESWEEGETRTNALSTGFHMVMAENARLRVSLAAGEMTEEGKKVAAMTMAALSAVITTHTDVILTGSPNPVQEPACEMDQEHDRSDLER